MPGRADKRSRRRRKDDTSSESSSRSRRRRRSADRKSRRKDKRSRSRRDKRSRSRDTTNKVKEPKIVASSQTQPKAKDAAVPDWLADLFPGGGAQSAPQAASAPASMTTSQVEIPLSLVGLLTSDNEAPIRQISSATNVTIQVRQDMQHLGYSLCFLTGKPDEIEKAKELIKQQVGLVSGVVKKEIEVAVDHLGAHSAMELARAEMQKKKTVDVSMAVLLPQVPGSKVRISIGPAQIHLVSIAEQLLRKKLSGVELDLCYKQGRPVPIEMKVAMLCKFYEAGSCSLAGGCQYCHGSQELALARRAAMPQGAEVARGSEPATLPRWPPLPGDIKALAPIKELESVGENSVPLSTSESRSTSATSGII